MRIKRPEYWWQLDNTISSSLGGLTGTFTFAGTNRTRVPDATVDKTPVSVGANVARFEKVGGYNALLVEPEGTNYFLNSDTPATQTTESLAEGTYTCWIDGTGSATVAANGATITGAGAAVDGTPVTFVVTVAGTVDVTIAGGPTRCQVENSVVPTSYIVTVATAVTRATESGNPFWTLPTGLFDAEGTAIVWWRPGYGYDDLPADTNYGILSCDDVGNSVVYNTSWGSESINSRDGVTSAEKATNWSTNTWYKLVVKWGYDVGGTEKFRVGVDTGAGVVWGTETSFDGSYTLGTYLRIGFDLFSRMHVRELMLFRKALSDTMVNHYTGLI